MRKPRLALLLGEATGIGPELLAKVAADSSVRQFADSLLIGDLRVFEQGLTIANSQVDYVAFTDPDQALKHIGEETVPFLDLQNLNPSDLKLGQISATSGRVTAATLTYALQLAKENKIDGLVYGPLNKEALYAGGVHFQDEMEFFSDFFSFTGIAGEMNTVDDLWIARATSHIGIKQVIQHLTADSVKQAILLANQTLKEVGYSCPRIGVCALNPHGGEGGLFGDEEIRVIAPVVEQAKKEGISISGPYPADTIFLKAVEGEMDVVLGMYHDQVQIGFKLIGFKRGVSVSAGLPTVITTPAHGTAFDIVGKGIADPGPMKRAIAIAAKMVESRKRLHAGREAK